MTHEPQTKPMPAITRILLTHKPAHIVACVKRHAHLVMMVDLVWSISDAIVEGRHTANMVQWDKIRNELQLVLDAERKETA